MAAQEGTAGGTQVMRMRYGDVGDSNFMVHGRAVPLLVGLLCALVFFVALCLYLRWRCGRYAPEADASSSSSSPAGAATAALPGLDADAIRSLPVTLYRALAGKGSEQAEEDREALCSICIGALVAGEKVKVLPPCGHCFHPACVDPWLRSHPSCPLCRGLPLAAAKPEANGNDEAV